MFLFQNARLIPALTEGYDGEIADVRVDGGRIVGIVPPGTAGAECAQIDLQGKTLMPGMIDLHVHLYLATDNFAANAMRGRNDSVFDCIAYASEFLRQGFTTVRDCGNPHYIGVSMREAGAAGIIRAPRIFTSGKCLSPFARSNDTFPNLYCEVNSPEEIRAACRYEYAMGVDFFKYMATGSVANLTGVPGELICSREELFALRAAADEKGVPAAVHCHGTQGILYCAQAGIDTIEHASMIDERCIDEILRQSGRTSIVPTLNPVINIHRGDDGGTMPKRIQDKIDEIYAHTHQLVEATRAGVRTGWGTDTSLEFYREHPGYEFDARREIGYTNLEMLEQATINGAKILGREDDLGTIKVGKLADLIVVDGKPDEDIGAMMQPPLAVFLEGVRC